MGVNKATSIITLEHVKWHSFQVGYFLTRRDKAFEVLSCRPVRLASQMWKLVLNALCQTATILRERAHRSSSQVAATYYAMSSCSETCNKRWDTIYVFPFQNDFQDVWLWRRGTDLHTTSLCSLVLNATTVAERQDQALPFLLCTQASAVPPTFLSDLVTQVCVTQGK